jgi:HEAT repeat protein
MTGIPLTFVLIFGVVPFRRTCTAVERCANSAQEGDDGIIRMNERMVAGEIAALGGPGEASRRLQAYVHASPDLAEHRWAAVAMVGRCGREAEWMIPDLLGMMISDAEEDREREVAAKAIGRIGGPLAARYLSLALRDRRWKVSLLAAEGLDRLQGPGVTPALVAGLDCPDDYVRLLLAKTLGRCGDAGAIRPLVAALREEGNPCVAAEFCRALASLRERAGPQATGPGRQVSR